MFNLNAIVVYNLNSNSVTFTKFINIGGQRAGLELGESSLTGGNQIADIGLGVHLIRSSSNMLSNFNLVGLRVDDS